MIIRLDRFYTPEKTRWKLIIGHISFMDTLKIGSCPGSNRIKHWERGGKKLAYKWNATHLK